MKSLENEIIMYGSFVATIFAALYPLFKDITILMLSGKLSPKKKYSQQRDKKPYTVIDLLNWGSPNFLFIIIFTSILISVFWLDVELSKFLVFIIVCSTNIILFHIIHFLYKYVLWKSLIVVAPKEAY